jgi:hypothetical protein
VIIEEKKSQINMNEINQSCNENNKHDESSGQHSVFIIHAVGNTQR